VDVGAGVSGVSRQPPIRRHPRPRCTRPALTAAVKARVTSSRSSTTRIRAATRRRRA